MSFHTFRAAFALPMLALFPACGPMLEVADDVEFRDTDILCPGCGHNSPRINDTPIGKVRLDGQANSDGVALLGIRPYNGAPILPVTVNTDDEFEVHLVTGPTLTGADLLHWELVFLRGTILSVGTIHAYDGAVPSLAPLGPTTTNYAIGFEAPGAHANVCPTYFNRPEAPVLTLIRGETYDSDAKVVENTGSVWLTLACADEAAYETKLLGYGPSSTFSVPARNATLKMLTADYCGTGTSYTTQGRTLWWHDRAATVPYPPNPPSPAVLDFEAAWTPTGALCLDVPRYYPREKIEECDLPTCDEVDLSATNIVWDTKVIDPNS